MEGWSTRINPSSDKVRRLNITHIGSANGFVDNGYDYLNRSIQIITKIWMWMYFAQMLSFVLQGAVIVIYNAIVIILEKWITFLQQFGEKEVWLNG